MVETRYYIVVNVVDKTDFPNIPKTFGGFDVEIRERGELTQQDEAAKM